MQGSSSKEPIMLIGGRRARQNLSKELRMLWEQHITWTRLTIISILEELRDVDPVTARLLRNPRDFQVVFERFYGPRIASEFAELFTAHLVIAAELINTAKAGDARRAADAERRWYKNAEMIAQFLGRINRHWSVDRWTTMLNRHLELTETQVIDILTGDYERGVAVYDEIERQALEMADEMVRGIVAQFPFMPLQVQRVRSARELQKQGQQREQPLGQEQETGQEGQPEEGQPGRLEQPGRKDEQ